MNTPGWSVLVFLRNKASERRYSILAGCTDRPVDSHPGAVERSVEAGKDTLVSQRRKAVARGWNSLSARQEYTEY